jgi:hypothetical protein
LIAYVVALALLAIPGIARWERLPAAVTEPAAEGAWAWLPARRRSSPSASTIRTTKQRLTRYFGPLLAAVRDVVRWTDADRKPAAELEIYRPGAELNQAGPAAAC